MNLHRLIRRSAFFNHFYIRRLLVFVSLTTAAIYASSYIFMNYVVLKNKIREIPVITVVGYAPNGSALRPTCQLPDADLIDPIKGYEWFMKTLPDCISCPNDVSIVSTVSELGVLRISSMSSDHKFYYRPVMREGDNDVKYGEFVELNEGEALNLVEKRLSFINVIAKNSFGSKVYERSHFYPAMEFKNSRSDEEAEKEPKFNVYVQVIESLSRLNFYRYMHKTRNVLNRLGNGQDSKLFHLKGISKVGDNSYPNMIAFLAAIQAHKNDIPNMTFDNVTMLWDMFERSGYETAYIEDLQKYSLLDSYGGKGYVRQPTTWYTRPYWLQIENKEDAYGFYCYHEQPNVDNVLNMGLWFYQRGLRENAPTFTFDFLVRTTHSDFNEAHTIDSHVSEFVEKFDRMDNTIFVLMGDHGNRYGDMLKTDVGWIEERMPMFAVLMPKKLLDKHLHLERNLVANEKRLTTWFDVHEMMKDIANNDFNELVDGDHTHEKVTKLGYSLWRERIPLSRDCGQAGIREIYCTCDRRSRMDIMDSRVVLAAKAFLTAINEQLRPHRDKCATLTLNAIDSAYEIGSWLKPDITGKTLNVNRPLDILISVKPSGGEFRGRMTQLNEEWILAGDATRLNAYGNQSHCVDGLKSLRTLCYCVN